MPEKLRWGILGVAGIAVRRVIPAMRFCSLSKVVAIASRDIAKARSAAREFEIPTAYGSYEELVEDPNIDAIYNPLPNHLHVPWSVAALRAGKHVLCEKPVGMTSAEALDLRDAAAGAGRKAGEAFMVRTHPRWLRAREAARSGEIGRLRSAFGYFSYHNTDPANYRNSPEYGGGGLLDIGCYPIFTSRFMFGEEPLRVSAAVEYDPAFKIDRLASAILEFPSGHAAFTCGTQIAPYQRMQFFGERGLIDMDLPFNAPNDAPTELRIGDRVETFPVCDQYTIQADEFSRAVFENTDPPVPIDDSVRNMQVIEAVFRAGRSGAWEPVQP